MPLEQGPDDRLTRTQARKSRPVRWGYLQQSVARQGVVTSRLVVYPSDSSDDDRSWAHRFHGFAPVALGGGTLFWLALIVLGLSPESSAIALAGLIVPVGMYLWWRARPVRRHTVVVWSSRLSLWPHPDDERREDVLTTLSTVMQSACDDLRRGVITRQTFDRTWVGVHMEAALEKSTDRVPRFRRPALYKR